MKMTTNLLAALAMILNFGVTLPVTSTVGLATVTTAMVVMTAEEAAANGDCQADTACDAARIQANLSDYSGPLRATTQTMVCIHALAYEPTELILANGDQPNGQPVAGHQLTGWRVQTDQWRPWPQDRQFVFREICFPEALLHEGNDPNARFRDALTLCNGIYLDQPLRNRSVFRSRDGVPQYISSQRRVEADDAACLLGNDQCEQFGL